MSAFGRRRLKDAAESLAKFGFRQRRMSPFMVKCIAVGFASAFGAISGRNADIPGWVLLTPKETWSEPLLDQLVSALL